MLCRAQLIPKGVGVPVLHPQTHVCVLPRTCRIPVLRVQMHVGVLCRRRRVAVLHAQTHTCVLPRRRRVLTGSVLARVGQRGVQRSAILEGEGCARGCDAVRVPGWMLP